MLKKITNLLASTILGLGKNSTEQPLQRSANIQGDYFVWNKGDAFILSPYFNTKEFSCQCNFPTCVKQRVSRVLIDKLDLVRKEADQSLIITSGFRCRKHQEFLRSSGVNTVIAKVSTHEKGDAADVQPKDKNIKAFTLIAEKHFDSIGLAKTFLHLDTRTGKRRWNY